MRGRVSDTIPCASPFALSGQLYVHTHYHTRLDSCCICSMPGGHQHLQPRMCYGRWTPMVECTGSPLSPHQFSGSLSPPPFGYVYSPAKLSAENAFAGHICRTLASHAHISYMSYLPG